MKLLKILIKTTILSLLIFSVANGGIANTKHNLSYKANNNIKSISETEICVFCHIPHDTRPGKPLWNRSMPNSSYVMYSSEYLDRANYPKAEQLGTTSDEPGVISRQCLSCHDGTVALGKIYMVRGNILGNSVIAMSGVNADGTMPTTSNAYIGTDLSIHHPVGVEYNPNISINFNTGSRSIELKNTPNSPVKLYEYGGKNYVECTSCHDPHSENQKFLRVHSGANLAQNIVNTCTSCHDKIGWDGSVHQSANHLYTDPNVLSKYGTSRVADLGCVNCHTPHNGEGKPYLLRKVEQNTCFQGAANSTTTAACHGTGGAKDIQSVLSRSYGHPVNTIDGVHTNLDILHPRGEKGLNWDQAKHAECVDCHNQHQAKPGTHAPKGQWYPNIPSNRVSNVLKGVPGVEPSWPSRWTQPTNFTTLESADKEYQICMKCHSYLGLGVANDGVTNQFLAKEGIYATDQAFEFNPNNRSAHPVVMPLNQMSGNYEPKALHPSQLKPPWNANPGNQTMYCSDCHGADNEVGGDPKGPHGSSHKFLLKGENNYWPLKPDGTYYTVWDDIAWHTNDKNDGLFCRNCHNIYADVPGGASSHRFTFGGMAGACVNCHVAVPHGSPVSNLIGYRSFPEPYNFRDPNTGELMLKIDGYKKAEPNYANINVRKVYSTHPSCMGTGQFTGSCHGIDDGGYDSVP